ncbi:MAG TPA: DinB family protein [Bryobacteraceae bacterium]|nr:DinB family protein [Bryobacteraceae bacterium]
MRYKFLVDTYETEIIKVLSVWSMFDDDDLRRRPRSDDRRGRNLVEHMVHQSVSEDFWFTTMLGIQVTDKPLPAQETRLGFMQAYERNSRLRLASLSEKNEEWWEGETSFFDVRRTRVWIMTRRLTHTAHHRGQQTTLLRMLKHDLHSTYGPTADTGGLMMQHAPTIYAYPNENVLLEEEEHARRKAPLPGPGSHPSTERPEKME